MHKVLYHHHARKVYTIRCCDCCLLVSLSVYANQPWLVTELEAVAWGAWVADRQ